MASLTIIAVPLLLSLFLYKYILYPLFFSPLSKIPNAHYSASLLPLWIRSKRQTGTGVRALLTLHEKHGPVLRVAPNEISVNSPDALRTVYTGGFEKHRWYMDAFSTYGTQPMVAMLEHKPHSIQKRMVSNVYSKSYLQSSQDLQILSDRLIFNRFLPIMQQVEERAGGKLDVLDFMQGVGMDLTSAYLFGLSNGTDFINDADYRHHWLQEYATFKFQLPQERADGEVERWCFSMCEAAERSIQSEKKANEDPSETEPVVYGRLAKSLRDSAQYDEPGSKSAIVIAASEMLDHLIAGHETSGITLTYLMHELSQRPYLQDRLRDELLTLDPPIICPGSQDSTNENMDGDRLPSPRSIEALPLLNNILQETLRLYAAAPAQQPRITPFSADGTTIEGYANIPGGVLVSANAHSLHRNKVVFPEPEKWRPERWDVADEKREEMKRWFWAFGSGGRMCLGSNFALQSMCLLCPVFSLSSIYICFVNCFLFPPFLFFLETWADTVFLPDMKLVIAAIYSNWRTEVAEEGDMEQTDSYIAVPKCGRCVLRFVRV